MMVSGRPILPAMSCAKALMTLVPHGSETCKDQFVVPVATSGGSELICTKTSLTPVSFASGSLAVPVKVTILVVNRDSAAGLIMLTTGPLVSGWPPGITRKRISPVSFEL